MVTSFKLQQDYESKLHFISASPCTSKHLSPRHRGANTEVSGWDSCTLDICLTQPSSALSFQLLAQNVCTLMLVKEGQEQTFVKKGRM
jgi:hypothetical protein